MDPRRTDLLLDLTELVSVLSRFDPSMLAALSRGLSCLSSFELPGIFDLMEPLSDLEDSFVSDLLNDGYDCRLLEVPLKFDDEAFFEDLGPSVLDGCWPILEVS